MGFDFRGPSSAEIEKAIRELRQYSEQEVGTLIGVTAAGAASVIARAYREKIYQGPEGVFGYPKDQNQSLAEAVQFEVDGLEATVFTNRPEALFVEFGTGIYGPKSQPIRPRGGKKFLAFPVYRVPSGFNGIFVPANEAEGDLPFGAIGIVLARQVAGMPARPVWEDPAVLTAINRIFELEARKTGLFR